MGEAAASFSPGPCTVDTTHQKLSVVGKALWCGQLADHAAAIAFVFWKPSTLEEHAFFQPLLC